MENWSILEKCTVCGFVQQHLDLIPPKPTLPHQRGREIPDHPSNRQPLSMCACVLAPGEEAYYIGPLNFFLFLALVSSLPLPKQ